MASADRRGALRRVFSSGIVSLGACALAALTAPLAAQTSASPTAARMTSPRATRLADSLLARMTLDEKLGQLTMTPAGWAQTGPSVSAEGEAAVKAGRVGSFLSF